MELNKEEALKSKEIAEKRFYERDFAGAKNYALKAKTLYPGLEGISQLVATFEVYIASEVRFNGEVDYYSVLGLKQFAEKDAVKKQYKKMAVLLHPDKNKSVGAEGAFKLLSEAWTVLSDNAKRKPYDHRNRQHPNHSSASPQTAARLDTFWTVCTACKVQYEYLRKYVNKRLSCKNCRGVFIAVETGNAPVNGSFPYTPWPYAAPPPPPPIPSSNGYGGYDGVTYVPSNSTAAAFFPANGVSGYHSSGHGYEYVSNVSFQWSTSAAGVVGSTGHQGHGNIGVADGVKVKPKVNGKRSVANAIPPPPPPPPTKLNRPDKRRKVLPGPEVRNGHLEPELNTAPEIKLENWNASAFEILVRRYSDAPAFDARKLLIDKARAAILRRLGEIKLSESNPEPEANKAKPEPEYPVNFGQPVKPEIIPVRGPKAPVSITVPDPDFHDFDNDRSEECFKPKQIWALYDEEDGMPRLYCLIREVITVNPFKILITYLNSKTDTEFGAVNWLYHGFTKSCGNFRAWTSDVVDQVNVFSHLLGREKAGRGGCVRLYPHAGDVWAVYRNWSPEWDRATPEETRHQYEMVEVLDEYHEDLGVGVAPLVKIPGFKTVYGRSSGEAPAAAVRWIPRREMVRFSHQVPSWLLDPEQTGLPEKCWDLDPAATPDNLLHCAVAGDSAVDSAPGSG